MGWGNKESIQTFGGPTFAKVPCLLLLSKRNGPPLFSQCDTFRANCNWQTLQIKFCTGSYLRTDLFAAYLGRLSVAQSIQCRIV
jgi:hypothetical protein